MAEKKYLDLAGLGQFLDKLKASMASGTVTVKNAEHATSADSATSAISATNATNATNAVNADKADYATEAVNASYAISAGSATSATKATNDGSGQNIVDTYETKVDATAKLDTAKSYTDDAIEALPDTYYTETEIDSKISTINSAISGKAASSHTHDDRYYTESEIDSKVSTLNTAISRKMDDFSIEIYNGTGGNPKPVRFATFNYSTCDSENGIAAKISLVSGHGNGTSYAFLEDAIIRVNHQGAVEVDNFKYYGQDCGTYDGEARQYGDIFWVVDTTNKVVDFYVLMGQYARVQQTPWKRLTYSSKGTVTQYNSCTVYSSGTKVYANNSEIATKSDIPEGQDLSVYAKKATTLSGYGITDAYTKTQVDTTVASLQSSIDGKAASSHSHSAATTSAAGFMSATDKAKLDGIAAGANAYSHPTTSGNKHIPSGGSSGQILRWSADGTAAWGADNNTTYSAGTGISLSGTTFSNSGVRSIATGTSNGTISVNTNGTSANVAVKGLGSAAYTASTAYDAAGTAQTKADAALASAKSYADGIKNDLLNGAGTAYDTLKELGDLIDDNTDAIDALETVAASKADASTLTSHTGNGDIHVTAAQKTNWNSAYTHSTSAHAPSNAEKNQNAFSNVTVGSTTIAADSATDTLTIVAGSNVTLTPDATNDKLTIAAKDTTYSAATSSAAGLMSASDKAKLDGIASGANNYTYTLPAATSSSLGGVKVGSNITNSSGTISLTKDNVVAALGYTPPTQDTNTTYSEATTSASGLMSAGDKSKLNGIASGAEVNQNAFSNVVIGNSTISADAKTDSLTLAGSNVTLTADTTNDKVTIGITKANVTNALGYTPPTTNTTYSVVSTTSDGLAPKRDGSTSTFLRGDGSWATPPNTTYSAATTSADGLMSASDKSKLNGIASGAEVNQNAFSNVTVGSTTIAADGKADTLTLVGSNVTLTPDATNDKVTIGITKANVVAALGYTPPTSDTNTTYSAGTGISLSGTTFSNSGVRSISSGSTNGTISVNTNGTSAEVAVKGLGSAAYTASTAYAAASHTHSSYVNQNAFSNVTVGSTTIAADTATDTLTLVAGNNVTITPDATNDKITIAATDTTYSSLKNPYALTIQGTGTTLTNGTYDGSSAKTVNITPSAIGAAASSHSHAISDITNLQTILDNKASSVHTHYKLDNSKGGVVSLLWLGDGATYTLAPRDVSDSVTYSCSLGDNTSPFTNLNMSGNAWMGGTLTVDQQATLNDTLTVKGITTVNSRIQPYASSQVNLGYSNNRWMNIYSNSNLNVSSDLKVKKDIVEIDDRYIELFDLVQPYAYKFIDGTSGRVHTGFISQHVEEAMEKVGLTAEELAFFCKDIETEPVYDEDGNYVEDKEKLDENGNPVYYYSLRYGEYVAIMTEKIKRMEKRIDELETKLEKVDAIEARLATLENA